MSGKLGTGLATNMLYNEENIEKFFNLRIKNIVIRTITLSKNTFFHMLKTLGIFLQNFITPILSPTLSHLIIQLNMENNKDIFLIEYGPYFAKDNIQVPNLGNTSVLSALKSVGEMFEENNKTPYWFINNTGGARISKLNYERYFFNGDPSKYPKEVVELTISDAIEDQCFGVYEDYDEMSKYKTVFKDGFKYVKCDILNKITLGELWKDFKGENWKAENYIMGIHDCQTFAAEVIRKLKGIRINEHDKTRMREKKLLPYCVIQALKENEQFNTLNFIGSIPILGFFVDLCYKIGYNLEK